MYSILLVIIYLAFISLGLPDSLLGSAWPVLHKDLNVSISSVGILTMIISFCTIFSSLNVDSLSKKFGTAMLTFISVLTTAIALFGFSISSNFYILCILCIPYGLGAGAVDAAINNYVALHYSSKHMSWLHCFWGVGASISPFIMSYAISNYTWNFGYRAVSYLQIFLALTIFFSIPLWKKRGTNTSEEENSKALRLKDAIKIKGVTLVLFCFFGYCALEATTGLWATTYLVEFKNVTPAVAAKFASFFYLGITFGRFVCGFITEKVGDEKLIKYGIFTIFVGIIFLLIPFGNIFSLCGLIIIGIGCAPIYPSIIHSTPSNFGAENSQAIIGIQMASAYVGATFAPPVFGLITKIFSISLYPIYLLIFAIIMLVMVNKLKKVKAV